MSFPTLESRAGNSTTKSVPYTVGSQGGLPSTGRGTKLMYYMTDDISISSIMNEHCIMNNNLTSYK